MTLNTDLQGKVALVTGGSRGIGRAITLALAGEGAAVVVNYRAQEAAARSVISLVQQAGGRAVACRADLTRAGEVDHLFQQIDETFGGLDILVLNAGQVGRGPVQEISDEEWTQVLDVNLSGAFYCLRAAVPRLIARGGGSIITISSDVAKTGGRTTGVHYAASKGGLVAMMLTLARQLAPYGIRVNDVAPAEIQTDMLAQRSAESLAGARNKIPLKRLGTPEDVAPAVVFLASEAARFITGISLDVNGGLHLG